MYYVKTWISSNFVNFFFFFLSTWHYIMTIFLKCFELKSLGSLIATRYLLHEWPFYLSPNCPHLGHLMLFTGFHGRWLTWGSLGFCLLYVFFADCFCFWFFFLRGCFCSFSQASLKASKPSCLSLLLSAGTSVYQCTQLGCPGLWSGCVPVTTHSGTLTRQCVLDTTVALEQSGAHGNWLGPMGTDWGAKPKSRAEMQTVTQSLRVAEKEWVGETWLATRQKSEGIRIKAE